MKGVQGQRLSDIPLPQVAPAVLHVVLLGSTPDLYKELEHYAAKFDGFDDLSIAALELLAACKENLDCLNEAETLLGDETNKAILEIKVLKANEVVECDKMPGDCQSSNLSWAQAELRGANLVQFNIWTRAFNLRVNAENAVKALAVQMAGLRKDVAAAENEVQTAENNVKGVPRLMSEGLTRGLLEVKVDTTKYFGGSSFAGGAAMKLLENRDQFFEEVLRDLPDEEKAASIRDIFLPLMALMEEVAHESRRATVS